MRRYRIFISSTIEDLLDARAEVAQCLSMMEVFEPIRIETFPASSEPSQTLCLDEVRKADAILLLLGSRYGYVPTQGNEESLSVTHLEYREARKLDKPVFAFIRECEPREPDQQKFIGEIQEFSHGVFRKLWPSIDILSKEVTRSFVWWLARLARRPDSTIASHEAASERLKSQKLDRVQAKVVGLAPDDSTLSRWVKSAIEEAGRISSLNLLPQPSEYTGTDNNLPSFTIRINRITTSSLAGMELLISRAQLMKGSPSQTDDTELSRFAYLELEVSSKTIEMGSIAIKCLMFLVAEDPDQCVTNLVHLARSSFLNETSRIAILEAAADLNFSHHLEHGCLVAEAVLSLTDPTSQLINRAIQNLLMPSAKLSITGLGPGYREVSRLLCLLFQRGLTLGISGAEAMYSLARQLLNMNPRMALPLYQQLVRVHPFYDERWYWHRDLGLLFYGEGELTRAATHYDQASRLKSDDSELFRYAGDAYFYSGWWVEALSRYQKALSIEPVERYFLDGKIEFCELKIRQKVQRERLWNLRKSIAYRFSKLGARLAGWNLRKVPKLIFHLAQSLHPTEYTAAKWLALFANELGDYPSAIQLLKICLCSVPESYADRLNLVLNLIFQAGGKWTELAMAHARAALFFAGPSAKERFSLCLLNTASKDELVSLMGNTLLPEVIDERNAWRKRRQQVLKPQKFGGILHVEFRP